MGIDHLVIRTGDRVTGYGWVRETDDGVWFDPGAASRLLFRPEPMAPDAVRLHGADLSAVATELGPDGSIPGWATVTGVWLGDAIEVERQSPERPARAGSPNWTEPPCPPPPGGWPTGPNGAGTGNLAFDPGDLEETGAAVLRVLFRPGPDQVVLVVAAADPAAVERRLRPQLGPRLCVVPSRWTKQQLDDGSATLRVHGQDWGLQSFGVGADEGGQAVLHADTFRVRPELTRWAAGQPDGLLEVRPVLAPA